MRTWKYFSKHDSKKEALGHVQASNKEQAIDSAASIKNLPRESFTKLFDVEKK